MATFSRWYESGASRTCLKRTVEYVQTLTSVCQTNVILAQMIQGLACLKCAWLRCALMGSLTGDGAVLYTCVLGREVEDSGTWDLRGARRGTLGYGVIDHASTNLVRIDHLCRDSPDEVQAPATLICGYLTLTHLS